MTEKKQKFEESMAELQKVTSEMESGDLSLEEMVKLPLKTLIIKTLPMMVHART
jgi:hypothetical protein